MKTLLKWFRQNNEFTFVIALILLVWYGAPPLLKWIDPQAGEFSIEMLYIPLLAGIFFFVALLFVWAYMKLVFPKGFRLLDDLFETNDNLTSWEKSQLILRLFGWLVVLFSASLLAVTGMSAVM